MKETPCLIIDSKVMKRNIDRMEEKIRLTGAVLRPHTKTHKIPEFALYQASKSSGAVTVAKVSEAEVMASNGLKDIFIAYPIIGDEKIQRVITLSRSIRVIVGFDSLYGAVMLDKLAGEAQHSIEVRMEVDTGLRRSGVLYEDALNLATKVSKLKNLSFTGIYTYRGLVLSGNVTNDRESAGIEEGRLMAKLAEKIRSSGIPIRDVSVGSTPTSEFAAQVPGVTEVRPGTYIFNDIMQKNLSCCETEDCAAWVEVTVVSKPSSDLLIIDGGSKTFATDFTQNVYPTYLQGYGFIIGEPDLLFERLNEEHSILKSLSGNTAFKIGDRLKIIPNHICTTINLYDTVYLMESDSTLRPVKVMGRGKLH